MRKRGGLGNHPPGSPLPLPPGHVRHPRDAPVQPVRQRGRPLQQPAGRPRQRLQRWAPQARAGPVCLFGFAVRISLQRHTRQAWRATPAPRGAAILVPAEPASSSGAGRSRMHPPSVVRSNSSSWSSMPHAERAAAALSCASPDLGSVCFLECLADMPGMSECGELQDMCSAEVSAAFPSLCPS